jgi:hypothetical protein
MSADHFAFSASSHRLSALASTQDGPPFDTKVTTMTKAEDRMWENDEGGWFRDQMTNQAIAQAQMVGLPYTELRSSSGKVILAKFSVRA